MTTDTFQPASSALLNGFPLWRRQIGAILGLEIRKTFLRGGAILIGLLCLLPLALLVLRAVIMPLQGHTPGLIEDTQTFAQIFGFLIRGVVFFGCVAIFTHLFRGEVLQRSLHFYFLAPIRRQVLMVGKYLAGLLAAVLTFGTTTLVGYWLTYLPTGAQGREYLWHGPGLGQALIYFGITVLACVGYGAVFLTLGLFFRNPMLPAAAVLGWETINFILPPLLKKFSVVYYLQSLFPVQISDGPLAFPADPVAPWIAIVGLLALASLLLWIAARRVRTFEVLYGED
ncbi:MAG: hypothetical protein ABI609_12150 [Acidobacteriota bacterium]